MSQSEVWKKRPTGLSGKAHAGTKCWLDSGDTDRRVVTSLRADRRKAGVKQRKY